MKPLQYLIKNYIQKYPKENSAFKILDLLKMDGCYSRDNYDGHFTASTWILSPDKEKALMY